MGNIYTRIMNPTQAVVEARVAALEGGVGALATSSGQAAETLSFLNLAESGDHLVSAAWLYGGTYNLLHYTMPKLGVEVTFVEDPDDLDEWRAAIRPNTRAFFGETLRGRRGGRSGPSSGSAGHQRSGYQCRSGSMGLSNGAGSARLRRRRGR